MGKRERAARRGDAGEGEGAGPEGLERGLPGAFVARLRALLSAEDLEATLDALATPRAAAWRVNPLRAPAAEIDAELAAAGLAGTPVAWCEDGRLGPAEWAPALARSAAFSDGRIYLQDPSSWLPVLALAPEPGEEVLDLAAAPGGKSLHLAARMGNRGRLAVVESVRDRFHRLRSNLERGGVTHAALYLRDGRTVGRAVPARFDRVLLDAPCSSEARFVPGDPRSFEHWSLHKVRECARKQRVLLQSAFDALRPGGRLVYCTCAFAPEENEAVVSDLLSRRAADVLPAEPLALPAFRPGVASWEGEAFDPRVARAVRVLPTATHRGFFLCVLTRTQ